MNARCDYADSTTLPNHASLFTGRPVFQPEGWDATTPHGISFDSDNGQTIHDLGNLLMPYKSSSFDVAHDYGLSTAFLYSKQSITFFARSWSSGGGPDLIGEDNGSNKLDYISLTSSTPPLVDEVVNRVQAGTLWNYTFVHFVEPDSIGHFLGWGSTAWSNAVMQLDAQVGRLLDALKANLLLADQAVLILSADHGGAGTSHNNAANSLNYTIPLFVWGPGIPAGVDLHSLFSNRADPGTGRPDYNATPQPMRNGDTANLALSLLGLPPIPGSSILPVYSTLPSIVEQPQSTTNVVGSVVQFTVKANGAPPLSYQWFFNDTDPITDATNATLILTRVKDGDMGAYRVQVTNPAGAVTSAVASLTLLHPPVPMPIPDQMAYVLSLFCVTNLVTDSDTPASILTFSLEPGAPAGARLETNTGVFTWTPQRSHARSTNVISIVATDNGTPPLSATNTFTVVVADYLELSLGNSIVRVGETTQVPIEITTTVGITNLSARLVIPADRIIHLAVTDVAANVALTLESQGPNACLLTFNLRSGEALQDTQVVAQLSFLAVSNQSAFVSLGIANVTAAQSSGDPMPRILANDGRAVVVGAAPLVQALPGTNGQRTLVLYGIPGNNYVVESCPDLLDKVAWQTDSLVIQLTNLCQVIHLSNGPSPVLFFRARQQ